MIVRPRFREPIDMIADDQPNTCPFDGARTEQLEQRDEYTVERCLECGTLFNFWQDEDEEERIANPRRSK